MSVIGKKNVLSVVKHHPAGVFLDGGPFGEILLPNRYVPENCNPDDEIEVFVYLDSEDRIVATTETPFAMIGEFALLKVVAVNSVGAFLDWGLMKDLLVPFREQTVDMEVGKSYLVHVHIDSRTNRIVASAKLDKFLDIDPIDYVQNQEVDLFICNTTDIGVKVIVNGKHWGMLYNNEIFKPLTRGIHLKGYIKKLREDGKIDLSLQKPGYDNILDSTDEIIEKLNQNNGFLAVSDSSSPDEIRELFGMSKKTFKRTIGTLYRRKKISIDDDGIRLVDAPKTE